MALAVISVFLVLIVSGAASGQSFIGVDYGPFHKNGQTPGKRVPLRQIKNDLALLAKNFDVIKTYGDDAASNLDQVVPIAATNFPNLKVYQGVFEDYCQPSPCNNEVPACTPKARAKYYNSAQDSSFLDRAIALANKYPNTVSAIVVGNECLYYDFNPHPLPTCQLESDINYVRNRLNSAALAQVQVTTGLGYASATNYGAQIAPYVDSGMVNIYPFYAPVAINEALSNLIGQPGQYGYALFVGIFSPKPVIIGETGWPSGGGNNGKAVPSVANERTYITAVISTINSEVSLGSTFLFEAFDEPWLSEQNSWGPHWGLWKRSRSPKFPIQKPVK
jgi:exo-beta-1,3-glucanase (GH17 family)